MKKAILLLAVLVSQVSAAEPASLSVGLGLRYGMIGLNLEKDNSADLSLNMGLGLAELEEPMFNVGLRYHPLKSRTAPYFIIQAGLIRYDIPCDFETSGSSYSGYQTEISCEVKTFMGIAPGIGLAIKHFEMDLYYLWSPAFDAYRKKMVEDGTEYDDNHLALSLGWRF